jgi:hypothetical protein
MRTVIFSFFVYYKYLTIYRKENKMKRKLTRVIQIGLLALTLAVIGTGCASSTSTRATALKPKVGAGVDLSKYQTATVLPFQAAAGKNINDFIGVDFSNNVAHRLQSDFGPLFTQVRKAPALGREDELIITGTIREYNPGDRFARSMLIGLGAASFKGDLIMKDGADNRVLFSAPFDKLWAWGGALGASKGIEEMVAESEAAVAATIAHAKGWKPPPKASKTKVSKDK